MNDQPVQVFLSLNRPALERLLGGDGELEVTLRKQIVDEFVERYLKEALERKVMADLQTRLQRVCDEVLKAYWTRVQTYTGTTLVLHDSLKQAIQAQAATAIDQQIREALSSAVQERIARWGRDIEGMIRRAVDAQLTEKKINELIDRGVSERLEMAASLCRNSKMPRSIELGGGNSGSGNATDAGNAG